MVGIIAIHAYNQEATNISSLFVFNHIQYFCSQVLGRVSVPLFFFFSGYLFFYKKDIFSKNVYIQQIKKRFWTLFIPYIFWISINISFLYFFDDYAFSVYYKNGLTFDEFLRSYWNIIDNSVPILYTLWFLRDLIILCILTPLIYFLIKKIKLLFPIIFLACWYLDLIGIPGFRSNSIFFFILGAYLSINKLSFTCLIRKIPLYLLLCLCLLFIALDLYYSIYNSIINKTCIIILIISILRLTPVITNRLATGQLFLLLSSSSFFIYLAHEPLLFYIKSYFKGVIVPMKYTIHYFASILTTLIITILLFLILKKLAPKFLNLIVGSRS